MRNTNETAYNKRAANDAALIYIAVLAALSSAAFLLTCFCLIRRQSEGQTSTTENQNRITSNNAVAIRIEQELSSNHRPGL